MSTFGAPNDVLGPLTVWTGHEMLVFSEDSIPGAIYNLSQDSWRAMAPLSGVSLVYAAGAWTGARWLVVGKTFGNASAIAGGSYDPVTDQWTVLSSVGALQSSTGYSGLHAHWLGSRLMVVNEQVGLGGGLIGFYSPDGDQWTLATTEGQPSFDILPCTVWDGQRLLAWGQRSRLLDNGEYEDWSEVWAYTPSL